jgi:hypothetical protein
MAAVRNILTKVWPAWLLADVAKAASPSAIKILGWRGTAERIKVSN